METTFKLKDSDKIIHKIHRHEPPVTSEDLEIIEINPKFIVINKPAGIPVHPCGLYLYNSITYILPSYPIKELQNFEIDPKNRQFNVITKLSALHRIDRVVSGLLFLSFDKQYAKYFENLMKSSKIQKQYLARVDGSFPSYLFILFLLFNISSYFSSFIYLLFQLSIYLRN